MQTKRFKQVRFRQLRAFVTLATAGSFASAAERLGLSVPSVWQQVRALETAFGCELVQTDGKRITLSERGHLLAALAAPLVSGFDEVVQTMSEPPRTRKRLAIAAPNHLLAHALAAPLDRFRREQPDVELRLVDRTSGDCIALVTQGEVDVAVVGRLDDAALPALRAERLSMHPFAVVCRGDHELAGATRLTLKAIVRYPLVIPAAGSAGRARLEEALAAAGLRAGLVVALEADTTELLLSCARLGFGAAVAPLHPAALEGRDGLVVHDVSRLLGHEHVDLVVRRARHQPAHEAAFCAMVRETAAG